MISIPKKYYLVVNDRFELFFRGVIRMHNPYQYYVKAECVKGFTYNRYFTFTPTKEDIGEYELSIIVYDDEGCIIEKKSTTLVVNEEVSPIRKLNVLCIGDSETVNGVWPYVGYSKFEGKYPDSLNFIGKMKKEKIGFEGYGGWQWKTFFDDEKESRTSEVWISCKHHLKETDLNSIWMNDEYEWVIDEIMPLRVKFRRGDSNTTVVNPVISSIFKRMLNNETLEVENYEYVNANPFYNPLTKELDFRYYLEKNNFPEPDLIFTFLTGNGLFLPFSKDFVHKEYAPKFLSKLASAFPNALIATMGIELPCCNGGVTACYGASGYYNDWYGYAITAFNYDEWLEDYTINSNLKDYLTYFDVKSQFDSEYNYPYILANVNNRSNIKERLGTNGLHPSLDGYQQIGDAFYRLLVEMIKKYNKKNK